MSSFTSAAAASAPARAPRLHNGLASMALLVFAALSMAGLALLHNRSPPPTLLRDGVRVAVRAAAVTDRRKDRDKLSLANYKGVAIVKGSRAKKEGIERDMGGERERERESTRTGAGLLGGRVYVGVKAAQEKIASVVRFSVRGGVEEGDGGVEVPRPARDERVADEREDRDARSHAPSRLFEHFDADNDGQLSEREVALLLKQLTRKRKDEEAAEKAAAEAAGRDRAAGMHDVSIDGETLSVGDGDFDLLFKQLSNLKQTKDPSKDPRMTLQEDIVFIKDLVIVFFAATIGGALACYAGQPALIGFLLGGMTVGPGGLGVVTELVEVETLASLGIAFLLFSLGIEFSLSDLQDVQRVVVVGGLVSMFCIVVGCGVLSLLLNLVKSVPEAIALGLAVSLSSTAVVLQCMPAVNSILHSALGENCSSQGDDVHGHEKGRSGHTPNSPPSSRSTSPLVSRARMDALGLGTGESRGKGVPMEMTYVNIGRTSSPSVGTAAGEDKTLPGLTESYALQTNTAFDSPRSRKVMLGLLVFQDVTIGLILALLPTLQGSIGQFTEEALSAMLRLGCFVVVSLILSEFIMPTLVNSVDRAGSQEVFTIGCVVFCLAMAYLSERMGLAIELGAFAAGIMLSESRHKARVEESVEGIRSVFSAVFFISVGMMIHWKYFYQNCFMMLTLLVVILAVKSFVFGAVICALGGLPVRTAIACGACIAQAGEFTFVIASKGQALLLLSASESRMINGATALSMLLTPYIVRFARRYARSGRQ